MERDAVREIESEKNETSAEVAVPRANLRVAILLHAPDAGSVFEFEICLFYTYIRKRARARALSLSLGDAGRAAHLSTTLVPFLPMALPLPFVAITVTCFRVL